MRPTIRAPPTSPIRTLSLTYPTWIRSPCSYTMPGTLLNMSAAAVSSAFDLGGASLVVDAACASALLALHEALVHLRVGHCDLAIAGGVYLNLVPDNLVAFSRIGAVSPR